MLNTSLCYIRKGEEVLLLHRTKKELDINKDKWIGIGGKFEEGESPEDCARREVKEETGLTLKELRYHGIVTFISEGQLVEFMHLFTADFPGGELITCDEGDLKWVHVSKLFELPHWIGDEIFLTLLMRDFPFFSLKLTYNATGILKEALLNEKPVDAKDFTLYSLPKFPPMRRKDRLSNEDWAKDILARCEYGVLSTINTIGYPYGIPLNYAYDGKKIYFHCAKDTGEKVKDFTLSKLVSFTAVTDTEIVSDKFLSRFKSVIVFGKVSLSKDPMPGLRLLIKKYSPEFINEGEAYIKSALDHVSVYEISIDHITGKDHK